MTDQELKDLAASNTSNIKKLEVNNQRVRVNAS
jgi:hypothetical protein